MPFYGILKDTDKEELTSLKVEILRHNIEDPSYSKDPLIRDIDDPELIKIPYKDGYGKRPIFKYANILVNQHKASGEPELHQKIFDDSPTRRRSQERSRYRSDSYHLPSTSSQRDRTSRSRDRYSHRSRSPPAHKSSEKSRNRSNTPPASSKSHYRGRRSRSRDRHSRSRSAEKRRSRSRSRRSRSRRRHERPRSRSPAHRSRRSPSAYWPPHLPPHVPPEYMYYPSEYWPHPVPRYMPPGGIIPPIRPPYAPPYMMNTSAFRPMRMPIYNSRPLPDTSKLLNESKGSTDEADSSKVDNKSN